MLVAGLDAVTYAAHDPLALAGFWADLLGSQPVDDGGGAYALPLTANLGFRIRFGPGDVPKPRQNRAHPDLTSTSVEHQQRTVERALALGARPVDVGQRPEEHHVVLADPEDNEFCVIEAGNAFLAGCPVVGAFACDGSEAVGRFWSAVLDWPLVWDRDGETAIRSAAGGSIISWGGSPVSPPLGRNRLHLDVVADHDRGPDDLVALGAVPLDDGAEAGACDGATAFTDPDGNEFCLLCTG